MTSSVPNTDSVLPYVANSNPSASKLRRSMSKYGKLGLNLNISIDTNNQDTSNTNYSMNNRNSLDSNSSQQLNQNQQSGMASSANQTPRRSFSLNHNQSIINTPTNTEFDPNQSNIPSISSTPLPTIDKLEKLDINVQLRLLALKEMSVVELRDTIKNLNSKLAKEEKELHKLREIIQKSLYKELSSDGIKNEPRDAAIASTKNRRRTLSSSQITSPQQNSSYASNSIPASTQNTTSNTVISTQPPSSKRNSIWGNLSKPLNLIQQFDTMLQTEFEKSLQANHPATNAPYNTATTSNHRTSLSQDSSNSFASVESVSTQSTSSPLKPKATIPKSTKSYAPPNLLATAQQQRNLNQPIIELAENDMLQTVSSHLWSFVSDVKSNLMNSSPTAQTNRDAQGEKDVELVNLETMAFFDDGTYEYDKNRNSVGDEGDDSFRSIDSKEGLSSSSTPCKPPRRGLSLNRMSLLNSSANKRISLIEKMNSNGSDTSSAGSRTLNPASFSALTENSSSNKSENDNGLSNASLNSARSQSARKEKRVSNQEAKESTDKDEELIDLNTDFDDFEFKVDLNYYNQIRKKDEGV